MWRRSSKRPATRRCRPRRRRTSATTSPRMPPHSSWRRSIQPPSMKRAELPRQVFWLGVVSFANDVASEMIFPLLPLFLTTVLGAGAATLGGIEGAAEGLSALIKIWSGRLPHRGRRKPLTVAGYAITAIVRPLASLATAPWHIL